MADLTSTAQHFIGFLREALLPTVKHAAQLFTRARPYDDMHVIGHDNPRSKFVTLTVKKPERTSHELSDFRLPKETIAVAGVEVSVHAGRIPTEQFLLLLPGERTFGGERVLEDLFALLLEAAKHLARQLARRLKRLQPRVFLRWFHVFGNFGQDARKTGRLEACPTLLRREHSFVSCRISAGLPKAFSPAKPPARANSRV